MTARRFTHKEAHSEKGDDLGPFLVQQSSKPPVFYIRKRSPGLDSLGTHREYRTLLILESGQWLCFRTLHRVQLLRKN